MYAEIHDRTIESIFNIVEYRLYDRTDLVLGRKNHILEAYFRRFVYVYSVLDTS